MIRKFKIHFAFVVILFAVYVISSLIYKRSLSDFYKDFLYYMVIGCIVFCINLIKTRKARWITFFVIFFAPLTYLIFTGTNTMYSSSLDVLVTGLPLDLPFFPDLYSIFQERVIPVTALYVLCFLLPLIYFYVIYSVSKMIFRNKARIN